MNQRTHSWIAIRAIALLEQEDANSNLVAILKPHAKKATVGAWLPDQADARRGGARIQNHVLKMKPYDGELQERFILKKADLLNKIGDRREISTYLANDTVLGDDWWDKPFKGDAAPGQHLPNRVMALVTMLKDLLLMGDEEIDQQLPGQVAFNKYLDPESRTTEEAVATYMFMISHFISDISMPCHCDGRKLAGYSAGLHNNLEAHWARKVGTTFGKAKLLAADNPFDDDAILHEAKKVDIKFDINFADFSVPDLQKNQDAWLECIFLTRASFALHSIMVPPGQFPYEDDDARTSYEEIFTDNLQLLEDVDRVCLHDAVLNTAIFWKHIWQGASR